MIALRRFLILCPIALGSLTQAYAFVVTNMLSFERHRTKGGSCIRERLRMLTELPGSRGQDPYPQIQKLCAKATQDAIKNGVSLIELEFPSVKGKLDVSLGETLDANRNYVRELAKTFSAQMGKALWTVFPDDGEAEIANKVFGRPSFRVTSINQAAGAPYEGGCKLQIVANPGFNIDEWIKLEAVNEAGTKAAGGIKPPMIVLNGSLDKIRGGYYPSIFYPGLAKAATKFLKFFEPVFYLKPMTNGWIFRVYPEDWQVILFERGADSEVLMTSATRPEYNKAAALVQAALRQRQLVRAQLNEKQ